MTAPANERAKIQARRILADLLSRANAADVAGMARFGIRPALPPLGGTRVPQLRRMAKALRPDHDLALELWRAGVHEARLLATMIDDPALVTPEQMDAWAEDLDTWDICDQACGNLFDRTPYAWEKIAEWTGRDDEFVKRAGFSLIAEVAVHRKDEPDDRFLALLPVIEREADDRRNFVRKSVNWALRQIGKRNPELNAAAIAAAERILSDGPRSARWVASDALRELQSGAVQARLGSTRGGEHLA